MKRQTKTTASALSLALVTGLIVTAAGILAPAEAEAGIRVQATVNADPVRATIVLGDGPRLCSIPKPYQRRTVVVRDCGCHDGHGRVVVKQPKHRRHDRHHKVWVEGHWERTGPRTARWIPGHWVRH